jgi:hypothetical protein
LALDPDNILQPEDFDACYPERAKFDSSWLDSLVYVQKSHTEH